MARRNTSQLKIEVISRRCVIGGERRDRKRKGKRKSGEGGARMLKFFTNVVQQSPEKVPKRTLSAHEEKRRFHSW